MVRHCVIMDEHSAESYQYRQPEWRSLLSRLLAWEANIRLGQKWLTVVKVLAQMIWN
jgi:hypothetical protein